MIFRMDWKTLMFCFLQVEINPLRREKIWIPSTVLKAPEILILSFTIRISLSARLFVNGKSGSLAKNKNDLRCFRILLTKAKAFCSMGFLVVIALSSASIILSWPLIVALIFWYSFLWTICSGCFLYLSYSSKMSCLIDCAQGNLFQ